MTPEQEHTFCQAAALGICLGLPHRYEWYVNADRALIHGPYTDIKKNAAKLAQAFMAFERRLATCDEEQAELDRMTYDDYVRKVNNFYEQASGTNCLNISGT